MCRIFYEKGSSVCSGFPLLIAIITMFFSAGTFGSSMILFGFLCLSVLMTLLVTKLLSATILKGNSSPLIMEMPQYRKPNILKTVLVSIKEKVLFVLLRAVAVAAPAGLVIWLLANIKTSDGTLLNSMCSALDGVGHFLGMDGVLLIAFILGFPANEIVIPIALMAYLSGGTLSDATSLTSLRDVLVSNGWTTTTALCTCIFSMFHFPCSTTLITVYKETKSLKWTTVAFFVPLVVGTSLCAIIAHIA